MRRAALLLLLLPATLRAQSVKLPAEVKIAPGRLAAVKVEWDGDDVRWDVPEGLDCFREYDPDPRVVRLRMIGYTPGRYRLLAVAGKGGKLSEFGACVVVVGDAPPPGPGPLPPGPGPTPDDPLYGKLQAAYAADASATKADDARKLAALYRQGAEIAGRADVTTWGHLFTVMADAARTLGVSDKLGAVQSALAAELSAKLPTERAKALDAPGRELAAVQFRRVATLLDALRGAQ